MTKTRNFLLLLLALALLTLFFARQYKRDHPAEVFTQTQDGITAVFSLSPASPATIEPVTLSLTLTDASGNPIEGVMVTYDLTMPGMTMPPNQPQATDKGGGLYQVETTFSMSGDWRAEVAVAYNGLSTPFAFNFPVK